MATFPGGRVESQTYADEANGQTTQTKAMFAYDDRGNPAQLGWKPAAGTSGLGGALGRVVANQTRNVAGLVTQRAATIAGYAQGWKNFQSDFTYDVLTRVASQTVTNASANPPTQVAKQQLDYFGSDDPARLRHWMGTAAYDFTYGYDMLHELTSVTEAGNKYSGTFAYGQASGTLAAGTGSGKLRTAVVATQAGLSGSMVTPRNVSYAYAGTVDPEAPTALVNQVGGATLRSYAYDPAGNQTQVYYGVQDATPDVAFVYDGDDQLRRSTTYTAGTTTVSGIEEYYYDHTGARVAVVTRNGAGTITKTRLFVGDTEIELTANNTIGTVYAYLSLGTPVAKVVSPTGGWTSTNTTWANNVAALELQYHGLSSNTLVSVNAGGTVQSSFVYAPYGDVVQTGGATSGSIAAQRRRFNDKFRDDLTGLSYYGVRYYDGLALGWTQADPMYRFVPDAAWTEPRKAGLYQFDLGNPVRYVDPDGRGVLSWIAEKVVAPPFSPLGLIASDVKTAKNAASKHNLVDALQVVARAKYDQATVIATVEAPPVGMAMAVAGARNEGDVAFAMVGAGVFGEGKAIGAELAAERKTLRELTDEAHGLLGTGTRYKSTAIGRFPDGTLGIASSDIKVPKPQREWAERNGIQDITGEGHAECTLMQAGVVEFEVASPKGRSQFPATGGMCRRCADLAEALGVSTTSPATSTDSPVRGRAGRID